MYLVFDIGGTKTRIAFSKNGKAFAGKPMIFNTPKKFKDGMELFRKVLNGTHKVKSAAGCIAGSFDKHKTKLILSPNLQGWLGKPLRAELEKIIKAPVHIENDADMAGLGEAILGAGKNERIVAYITVSTGVGGAKIVDKKLDANAFGFEPGMQIVDQSERKNAGSKKTGNLEDLISGAAMEKKYGKKPAGISNRKAWEEEARLLSIGLYNAAHFWSPDIIILGGSMITKKVGIKLDRVKYHFEKMLKASKIPRLAKAKLGENSGLYGALEVLRQKK